MQNGCNQPCKRLFIRLMITFNRLLNDRNITMTEPSKKISLILGGSFETLSACRLKQIKLNLAWTVPYLIVGKISNRTYTIQRVLMSCKFNVHVDHLKAYMGSPRPWFGLEGIPMNVSDADGSEDSYQ